MLLNEVIDNIFKFDVEWNPDEGEQRHEGRRHLYKNGPKFMISRGDSNIPGKCIKFVNCVVELDDDGDLKTFRTSVFAEGFAGEFAKRREAANVLMGVYENHGWMYDNFRDIYSEWYEERRASLKAIEAVKKRTRKPFIETLRFLAKFVIEEHVNVPDRSEVEGRYKKNREQRDLDNRMERLRQELERMRAELGRNGNPLVNRNDEGRLLIKMLVNETINRYLFENTSRRGFLNEGIKSNYLRRLSKKHGGVRSVNKELMLDKNEYPHYWFFNKDEEIPYYLRKYVISVMEFNDGSEVAIENPKYTNIDDPDRAAKVQDLLSQYSELIDARSADYPGHSYDEWEDDVDTDGTTRWYKYTHTVSPNDERQSAHRRSRGKKTRGVHKSDDKGYQRYVDDYARQLADELGLQTLHDYSGDEYFYYHCNWDDPDLSERDEIVRLFRKYGYGNHDIHLTLFDEDGNEVKASTYNGDLLLAPGIYSRVEGGRNPQTGHIDFYPRYRKVNPPRIGTSEFFDM